MNYLVRDNGFKKRILEMTNEEYDATVDRLFKRKEISSEDDGLMLLSILKNKSATRWDVAYKLLVDFFDGVPSEDCDIFTGEVYLFRQMGLYINSGNMPLKDVVEALDFAYKLDLRGSLYAHCFMLNIISMERECCCIEEYREVYNGNEFFTRAFGGDNPPETLGLMALEFYNGFSGGRKVIVFSYLDSLLLKSSYICDAVRDIESLEFDSDFFKEGDFGEKEFILAEYYYYKKADYERSMEYAKISSKKGNSGAYLTWALSLYSDLYSYFEEDNKQACDKVCEVVVEIIELMRLAVDGFVEKRGLFFRNIGDMDFLQKNLPLVLSKHSPRELSVKLCDMASKGSPFEQYLVFDRKEKLDNNYDFISDEQAFKWAVNAVNYTCMGGGKIPLGYIDAKDRLTKKINKERIKELLSY